MASTTVAQSQFSFNHPASSPLKSRSPLPPVALSLSPNPNHTHFDRRRRLIHARRTVLPRRTMVFASATTAEMPKKKGPEAGKGFVDEMRAVAMRLHTRTQAREGEKEPNAPPIGKWEPSVEGYLRFLVDSKLVYDTLESIVRSASCPWYAEFRDTGLERSEKLAKDLEWFKEQGNAIPEPSTTGISYAQYLEELREKDPQAFICHFYNIYFAHTAGGRMIGKKLKDPIRFLMLFMWRKKSWITRSWNFTSGMLIFPNSSRTSERSSTQLL